MKPTDPEFFRRHGQGTAAGLRLLFSGALVLAAFAAAEIAPWRSAWAQLIPVHDFKCPLYGAPCPKDGLQPSAGVIMDGERNLYGTTSAGGQYGLGTVYKLIPTITAGKITAWTPTILHDFCPEGSTVGCTDGYLYFSNASLIMDGSGVLYGTTSYGGNVANCPTTAGWSLPGCGVVFKLTPPAAGDLSWNYQVLYRFCQEANCADGATPSGPLILDGSGNLYGETMYGGSPISASCAASSVFSAQFGCGTVFELKPNAAKPQVLYSFCSETNCADGLVPAGGLIWDGSGNLYGTSAGTTAVANGGAVFKLMPPAAGESTWSPQVLYTFCTQGNTACPDGSGPSGPLVMDGSGNLYGTTVYGGSGPQGAAPGSGTVFELKPPEIVIIKSAKWSESVLHSFVAGDGQFPNGGLVMDCMGDLYGTTSSGGAKNAGIVFELIARENYRETPPSTTFARTKSQSQDSRSNAQMERSP
jgi:hypothetical protein